MTRASKGALRRLHRASCIELASTAHLRKAPRVYDWIISRYSVNAKHEVHRMDAKLKYSTPTAYMVRAVVR